MGYKIYQLDAHVPTANIDPASEGSERNEGSKSKTMSSE